VTESCATCYYFRVHQKPERMHNSTSIKYSGQCKRYPPVNLHDGHRVHDIIEYDNHSPRWCGEYIEKEEP